MTSLTRGDSDAFFESEKNSLLRQKWSSFTRKLSLARSPLKLDAFERKLQVHMSALKNSVEVEPLLLDVHPRVED